MSEQARFKGAFPYQKDVLALPVPDLDRAATWYAAHFNMIESGRVQPPAPAVIMERDGTKIGFAVNGGDATQDGAAILVSGIRSIKDELEQNGVKTGDLLSETHDGHHLLAFFVVAPDGLCYYFHEPVQGS